MALLRFCGVRPASVRMREDSASLLMASAWSARSTVTKLSPALLAICSAWSSTRASAAAICGCAAPPPAHLGQLGERGFGLLQRLLGVAAGARDQPGRQPLGVVEQHLQQMLGRDLRVAFAHGKRLRRLDESLEAV